MIPALVLTAGLGTRLRPLSRVRAKAALPVAGVPLIQRIVTALVSGGVRDLVLNLHHLPHTIAAVTGDGGHLGARIRYSWELPLLGSAGGPRRALPLLVAPQFLIVNGDTLTDVDVYALVQAHHASGALVTMALVPNREPEKYGGVLLDRDGSITGFVRRGAQTPSFHFIGVQAASAEAFASVPEHVSFESVGTLYPALIRQRPGAIRGFVTEAEFLDVGTAADYLRTSLMVAARERPAVPDGSRSCVATTASVTESVLWDDVTVEANARLHRCIVTDGVIVPADSHWSDVTIRSAGPDPDEGETIVGQLAIAPLARP
ncbi:MAG: hypothetical protein EXQ48_07235 [Acidobacteria bacterium]|nr:hypothetical protein [Acidobacteriota bacterium]